MTCEKEMGGRKGRTVGLVIENVGSVDSDEGMRERPRRLRQYDL